MYYPDDLVEEIRTRNDVVDVIGSYIRLQKKGSSYFGLCPFHTEKTPSFSVSRQKQMYYCFGCGTGGNVFTFIEEYENFTFQESVKYLADRVGIKLPEGEESVKEKQQRAKKQMLMDANRDAAYFYHHLLRSREGEKAYNYLTGRMLSDKTVNSFGLGYSPKYSDALYKYLKQKGYADEILKESGLFHYDEKRGPSDRFFNRVMFPIMDVNSRVIGFGGRVMGDALPKYLNSPETSLFDKSRNLYGLNAARTSRKSYALLCEGYMDVISLHQAGFNNAVASLGTSLTQGQAILLKRYFDKAVIAYDSDGAGRTAAIRAIPILRNAGFNVKVLRLSPYKDPDEFLKAEGEEAFEKKIKEAVPGFLFEIYVLEQSFDMSDPDLKTSFYRQAAERFLIFDDEIERNNYIEAFCRIYDISRKEMESLINKTALKVKAPKSERAREPSLERQGADDVLKRTGCMLFTFLSEDEDNFRRIERYIAPEDFSDDVARKAAEFLYEGYRTGKRISPGQMINFFPEPEDQKRVAALFNAPFPEEMEKEEKEKALTEIVKRIKKQSIERAGGTVRSPEELKKLIENKKMLQELKIEL